MITILWLLCCCIFVSIDATFQIISRPGQYALGSNIVFTPSIANDCIIKIVANDVTLDLAGYFISQDSATIPLITHGIIVDPNLSNVIIQNGYISNLTGTGIHINQGCSEITLQNLHTFSCDLVGIQLTGTDINPITNILIDQCETYSCTMVNMLTSLSILLCTPTGLCMSQTNVTETPHLAAAVHAIQCQRLRMQNCVVHDNSNMLQPLAAVTLQECQECFIDNVSSISNSANDIVVGFLNLGGFNNTFRYCNALKNVSLLNIAFGFVLSDASTNKIIFSNCVSSNNVGATNAAGFYADAAQQDLLFQDCLSINNTTTTDMAFGYILNSGPIRTQCINSIAQGNTAATNAAGFVLGLANDCQLINCIASDQRGGALSAGFDFEEVSNCQIRSCESYRNVGLDALSFGFRITGTQIDNQFITNIAADNGTVAANQMFNFVLGTFSNISYGSLGAVTSPFINLGIVP